MISRHSIRLREYDYASEGMYYVTLCTEDRREVFGEIRGGEMLLSPIGQMVRDAWLDLPRYDPRLYLDEFIVMPNHLHGLIGIGFSLTNPNGGQARGPAGGQARGPAPTMALMSLSDVIQRFKSWTTFQYRKMAPWSRGRLWQRNFYEHIVRGEEDLHRIREYIKDNPKNWKQDPPNPPPPL